MFFSFCPQLTFVPSKTLANLSEVRQLDLSHNELPAPPSSAWHDSFVGLERLEELDISDISASTYQVSFLFRVQK